MKFLGIVDKNKSVILEEWFSSFANSYSSNTFEFIKNNKDPFANPVGQTTISSLSRVLEGLISGVDINKLELDIYPIIRIRAVQGFKASEALKFIFIIKGIVRKFLNIEKNCKNLEVLSLFENRVDILAMVAFDVYIACREKIYELKANEARNQFFSSLSRAGLITET